MANCEHIRWLLEGIESWNSLRENEPFFPDFENANLVKAFRNADKLVQGIDLEGNCIDRIPLANADLRGANFEGAILVGADLARADLTDAVLSNAKLNDTILRCAILNGADLVDADLWSADLTRAKLHRAKLINAKLIGAHLCNAELCDAHLIKTKLAGAHLCDAKFTNAKLKCADLLEADLTGADLSQVEYLSTDTILAGAEPWKANLYSTEERNVSLQQYQCEMTLIITVGDLLEQIKQLQTYHDETSKEEIVLYFRGESKCGRSLLPGVMRPGNRLRNYESEMLTNLVSRYSGEFRGLNSALEEWALAQHHGLSTRFLDVTRNPLVALFNACKNLDHYRESGRVHILAVPRTLIKPFNSDTLSVIANFSKLKRYEQDLLLGKKSSTDEYGHYDRARLRLYQGIKQEKSYFEERIDIKDLYKVFVTEPQQFSERVKAQSGAFLVSAFHENFDRDAVVAVNKKNPPPIYAHYKLVIPSSCKGNIMDELRLLNITNETLSPGLDSSAEAVKEIYSRRGQLDNEQN